MLGFFFHSILNLSGGQRGLILQAFPRRNSRIGLRKIKKQQKDVGRTQLSPPASKGCTLHLSVHLIKQKTPLCQQRTEKKIISRHFLEEKKLFSLPVDTAPNLALKSRPCQNPKAETFQC